MQAHSARSSNDILSDETINGLYGSRAGGTESSDLGMAAIHGMSEVVASLLARGADINAKDAWGATPLHQALRVGQDQIAALLLSYDPNLMLRDSNSFSAFDVAVIEGRWGLAEQMLSKGYPIDDAGGEDGRCILADRAKEGHLGGCRFLLEHGAHVAVTDKFGRTPLHLAALKEHENIALLLLEYGADIEARNHNNATPLMTAVVNSRFFMASLLICKGAQASVTLPEFLDKRLKMENGAFSRLHAAVSARIPGLVLECLEAGSDPSLKTSVGTARDLAMQTNQSDLAGMIDSFCAQQAIHSVLRRKMAPCQS